MTVAPNILQQEAIISHIIQKLNVQFQIDRVFLNTLKEPKQMDNCLSYIGFAAISPSSTKDKPLDASTIKELNTIEHKCSLLFNHTSNYQTSITNIPLLQHINFKLPHLNNFNEHNIFLIEGLSSKLIHHDIASFRELGADIFRAIHSAYKNKHPHTPTPAVLNRHASRFLINELLSIRPWTIPQPPPQTTAYYSPQRNNNTQMNEKILTISMDPINPQSAILQDIITSLLCETQTPLTICGGKLTITLTPFSSFPRINSTASKQILQRFSANANNNYHPSKIRIIRDIPIHPTFITNPLNLTTFVQNNPLCRAAILNLKDGRNNPYITLLTELTTSLADNTDIRIFTALAANSPSNIFPTATLTKQMNNTTTTQYTTHTKNKIYSMPSTINNTKTAPRYYVIPNPKGGIAMAGIYRGHFDNDQLRDLCDHVSLNFNKSFATLYEAILYLKQFYPQLNNMGDILFMNYNSPIESTNLNNPSPAIQKHIINLNPTNHPKEHPYFNPEELEPFIVASRTAASERMRNQNLTPKDSYDFLPPNYNRHFNSPNDLPINLSLINANIHQQKATSINNTTPIIQHLIPHINTNQQDDDCMSQISIQTASIQLNNNTNQTTLTSPKRQRLASDRSINTQQHHASLTTQHQQNLQTTHTAFTVPITIQRMDIFQTLWTTNIHSLVPKDTITQIITFVPILSNNNTKLAYLQLSNDSHNQIITTCITQAFPGSHPRPITEHSKLPSLITNPPTLDTTPSYTMHFPTNCRITTCPLYNNGIEEPIETNDIDTTILLRERHGKGIHNDLLLTLDAATLNSIGWIICCPTCSHLSFTNTLANIHRSTCQSFITTTTTNNNPPNNELSQQTLFKSCPPQHHNELQLLLDTNTDPAQINATILRWHSNTQSNNAITNTHHDDQL